MRTFWVAERFDRAGKSTGYYSGPNYPFFTRELDKAVQFSRRRDVFWTGYSDQMIRFTRHRDEDETEYREYHQTDCICADCSGAELTSDND